MSTVIGPISTTQLIGHHAAIAFHEASNISAFATSERRGLTRDDKAAHAVLKNDHILWPDRPSDVRETLKDGRASTWTAFTRPAQPWTTPYGRWALTLPEPRRV